MKGFLLLLSFLALTLIARLAAVYFYLAPSMGFFNLLSHKKFGQMMFRDGIDSANWTHVDSYKAMTRLSSTAYSVILICSVIVHYFLVLFIMIRFAGKMKPFRERISEKFFHLSTQLLCPSNYKD
jgi:NhaP-type Na+/H+ or K+/H+ antiporter